MDGWHLTINDSVRFVKNTSFGVTTRGHRAKGFPLHAMKSYRWSRDIAPFILSHCTTWKRVANFTPLLLGLHEITTVPIKWDGPQSRSGGFGEMSLAPFGIRTPHHIYIYTLVCVCVRNMGQMCIIWTC